MPTPCCSCGQLSGCVCAPVSCGLTCERKSGTAELCGFDEFLPSDPPQFYKRRQTSGTMNLSSYFDPTCGSILSVPAGLNCQKKAGTAAMIGIPEFSCGGTPSSPPKYYRRNEASGTITEYNNSGCPSVQRVKVYSGAITYDSSTGVTTDTRCLSTNGGACSVPSGFDYVPGPAGWSFPGNFDEACLPGDPVVAHNTCTLTEGSRAGTNYCCDSHGFGFLRVSGSAYGTLSDEDTQTDAINRAKAAIGAWTSDTCANSSSFQSPRTGSTFGFRAGQTRVAISGGLTSGENYEAVIHISRRVTGSGGAFIHSSDISEHFTASGATYTGAWQDLPTDATYEYMAVGVDVYYDIEEAIVDNWSMDESFVPNLPAVCAPTVVTDASTRTVDGSPVAWPFDGSTPGGAYGGLATGTIAAAERQTIGTNTCTASGSSYVKASGTVLESLSQEDTEDDAIQRAVGASAWSPCAFGCATSCTSFLTQRGSGDSVFGFAIVRTKASWTAVIGHTYHVTIRLASRILGTGGPFLLYGLLEATVVADAVSESTDWIDVPNIAGLEIIAANCLVTELP